MGLAGPKDIAFRVTPVAAPIGPTETVVGQHLNASAPTLSARAP